LRYLRWIFKAGFLLIFTVPIFYLPSYQELGVGSFLFSKPSGQISGFTSIEEFFMVPIGQSPDIIWLSYYGDPNPGYWVVEPFGGLQVLLSGQVGFDLLFSTLVAILFFVGFIVLLGNVFCSWSCPVGSIIDSFDMVIGKLFPNFDTKRESIARKRVKKEREQKKHSLGCGFCPVHRLGGKVAGGVVVFSLVGSFVFRFPVFCAICPIGVVSRGLFHFKAMMSITGAWMVYWLEMLLLPVGVVLLSLRERRFFCKRICPVGALLGGVGALNPFIKPKIKDEKCVMKTCPEDCEDNRFDGCYACRIEDDYKCEKVCPVDIDLGNQGSLARCTKCMECYIVCPYDAIKIDLTSKPYGVKLVSRYYRRIKRA
jgi:ferredoxin-type protein NapH